MTHCYVVLAHTDPEGLRRLIDRIRRLSPTADIVVRYDDPALISEATLREHGALPLVSRLRVRWGDWSLVEAAGEALAAALNHSQASWFSVISGQDYPVRRLTEWEKDLIRSDADLLLDPMPAKPQTWQYRWSSFAVTVPGHPLLERLANGLIQRGSPLVTPWASIYRLDRTRPTHWWVRRPRRHGADRPDFLVKASQWMTVRRDVLDGGLAELATGSARTRFLRSVLIPDEIALQSLCAAYAGRVQEAPTTAASFAPDAPSPDWLTPGLVQDLARSGAPFVRKIPPSVDPAVIEVADALCDAPVSTGEHPRPRRRPGRVDSHPHPWPGASHTRGRM